MLDAAYCQIFGELLSDQVWGLDFVVARPTERGRFVVADLGTIGEDSATKVPQASWVMSKKAPPGHWAERGRRGL